jgi:uncharacterized protein (TIGR03118 family)
MRAIPAAAIAAVALLVGTSPQQVNAQSNTGTYLVTNLVSDQPGVALLHDPNLVNPWGIALNSAGGAFWVANNQTSMATLYSGDVNGSAFVKASLEVTIPGDFPTGTVFNPTQDFAVTNGTTSAPALFLFASQTGFITGWNPTVAPSTTAKVGAMTDAVYTGLALGTAAGGTFLYAADFAHGKIDVFDGMFRLVHLAGTFTDPEMSRKFAPFNIQNLGGRLYVTYARQSKDEPGEERPGQGFVNVFDTSGNLLQRLVKHHQLNAPWGLAQAPANFGPFSGALLVGNFGDGRILTFHPTTGEFLGTLDDQSGKPIEIDGLWGLTFGNGATAGDRNALYFAAGPDDETHGLFGSIRFVGE